MERTRKLVSNTYLEGKQETEEESLEVLVQRELLQCKRIKEYQNDRDEPALQLHLSPANSPKHNIRVPEHRDVVAKWMNEAVSFGLVVSSSCSALPNKGPPPGPRLFTLAASLMDMFLMKCKIKLSQLQLLGSACLSLAAKSRKIQLSEDALIECSDYAITTEEIQAWEKLVLTKLDWNVNLVIPQDYLDLFCINMNILPTFNDANKRSATPNEDTGAKSRDNKNLAMTTTKYNKNTANEGTKELGNKTSAPNGDNQHPETTNKKECSSSSLLSTCTLHPIIAQPNASTTEKIHQVVEDTIEDKKQIALEDLDNDGGLDPIRTQILHDADLMSSLCSCSYALTNYYPPRTVAIACLLLTARHHCYHLHGNNRSRMSEGSQSTSPETVAELLKNLFYFHGDYSSTSSWHAAACLLQRLKLLPCHYSKCHTNEEENENQDNCSNELGIIANVMGEIEQFLCTNLPSPTLSSASSEQTANSTVSPPTHSSLSITASISMFNRSPTLSDSLGQQCNKTEEGSECLSHNPVDPEQQNIKKSPTTTPPLSSSSNAAPTESLSPSSCHTTSVTTSTPKSRPPLICKDNLRISSNQEISYSRRRLQNLSENECNIDQEISGSHDKENNDSAIGMILDCTGTSSKGSSTQNSSSPSSNGSSKTSSPDSGTSTVSHTKVSVPEIETLKRDFDLNDIEVALPDCVQKYSNDRYTTL